ncbi:MAG: hypothetical protein Q8O81_13495, partial [Giesbergeria sp.]|nr:hypothetical protein [Giesbergeria sp.]
VSDLFHTAPLLHNTGAHGTALEHATTQQAALQKEGKSQSNHGPSQTIKPCATMARKLSRLQRPAPQG